MLLREFGFGQSTGIKHLADEPGILPDQEYFQKAKRWDGEIHPYGPFDQIQLAIGQGSYLGTPLQLANAYAAIGNGGKLWTPRIVVVGNACRTAPWWSATRSSFGSGSASTTAHLTTWSDRCGRS